MHIDQAIRSRKTEKVFANQDLPISDMQRQIEELLFLAGQAPFHRVCEERHRAQPLDGIEPWRFHVLNAQQCRSLYPRLPKENAGKIPAMLAAADALIMATWLPHAGPESPMGEERGFSVTLTNVEHIAAASAAIENLLLAATARGISNYWSSGGILRLDSVFQMLSISPEERLLGAIFLFPKHFEHAELGISKLRAERSPWTKYARWVSI